MLDIHTSNENRSFRECLLKDGYSPEEIKDFEEACSRDQFIASIKAALQLQADPDAEPVRQRKHQLVEGW